MLAPRRNVIANARICNWLVAATAVDWITGDGKSASLPPSLPRLPTKFQIVSFSARGRRPNFFFSFNDPSRAMVTRDGDGERERGRGGGGEGRGARNLSRENRPGDQKGTYSPQVFSRVPPCSCTNGIHLSFVTWPRDRTRSLVDRPRTIGETD